MFRTRFATLAVLLAALAGCAEQADTPTAAIDGAALSRAPAARGLQFVHRAPHTPPFKGDPVVLEARVGSAGEATLSFADGTPFARFSLSEESLRGATVKGVPVAEGETLVITLRRADASRYMVDLQPSGLVFNPDAPARLEFFYENAIFPAAPVSVFKQEHRGDRWQGTQTADEPGRRVMRARVDDFTIYAMAGQRH